MFFVLYGLLVPYSNLGVLANILIVERDWKILSKVSVFFAFVTTSLPLTMIRQTFVHKVQCIDSSQAIDLNRSELTLKLDFSLC